MFYPRLYFSRTMIKHCSTKTYFMIYKKFPDCPFNLPNIDIIYFLRILLRCGACFCSKSDKLFSNKVKNFHVSLSIVLIVTQYKFQVSFWLKTQLKENVFIDNFVNQERKTSHSDSVSLKKFKGYYSSSLEISSSHCIILKM